MRGERASDGEHEGRLPEGGDILRWVAILFKIFFYKQTDQWFHVSPAGLRELHLLPNAALRWCTDSGDVYLQEAP